MSIYSWVFECEHIIGSWVQNYNINTINKAHYQIMLHNMAQKHQEHLKKTRKTVSLAKWND